ncbi:hypothetical protein DM01DRAFT_1408004 [Hesseltinella vesiculosa]|uniref:Uncharacterized protein n=1 Tax=Hesseltinella vesiculosa TaxID=101127 RepID=A0A1X2GFI0_9FUNG|nr:hypothetical protein DM01DRAFT_1408004 [Hesseltinella vesiculosa]
MVLISIPPNTPSLLSKEYPDEVFSWEQVYHFVQTNQIKRIHRHPSTQAVYQKWLDETLAKYGTIENYLLSTKLAAFDGPASPGDPSVILLPNDFPYSVERGIDHQLLWSRTPLSPSFVESYLQSHYDPSIWEWVYFVNPPEVQSVKKLPHVHIFLRHRPTAPSLSHTHNHTQNITV